MELRLLSVIGLSALAAACGGSAPHSSTAPPSSTTTGPTTNVPVIEPAASGPSVSQAAETESKGAGNSPEGAPRSVEEPFDATNASLEVERASNEPHGDLPRGTTVLHIGDSFAGALGIELNRELKDAGVRGILKYETATYIPTWAWGKDLEKYLSKYHPDLVMITLGANELEITDPASRGPTIHHLVERLRGRPCVWVAPPLWQGARPALLDVIRSSCAPCAYLDSSSLVPDLPRARDGIHPAMAARKAWAKAVFDWLAEHRRAEAGKPWELE